MWVGQISPTPDNGLRNTQLVANPRRIYQWRYNQKSNKQLPWNTLLTSATKCISTPKSCAHHDACPKVLAVSKTLKMRLTVHHTNPIRQRRPRASLDQQADHCSQRPTTQPGTHDQATEHPTGDDVQTVDTHDQRQQKLAQPTPETFPKLSNLPGSGTRN